jgi:hypothetical protein
LALPKFFCDFVPINKHGQAFKPIDSSAFTIMAKISEKQFNSNTCFTSIDDLHFKNVIVFDRQPSLDHAKQINAHNCAM